jgi:hypothetical protein
MTRKLLEDCWDAANKRSSYNVDGGSEQPDKSTYITSAMSEGKDGIDLIAVERDRQKTVEGWTPEHDATHRYGELAKAAACYVVQHTDSEVVEHGENAWPWDDKWWKPSYDPIKNLVKAGALIAAEIDRLKSRTP